MKLLISSQDGPMLGLFQSRLESEGIQCHIRGEYLSTAMGIGAPFDAELWVLRDEQFVEARELLAAWQSPDSPANVSMA